MNIDFHKPLRVIRDVHVVATSGKVSKRILLLIQRFIGLNDDMNQGTLFMFWFHTAFVKDGKLVLTKPELDKACRDKKKVFSKDFQVEMYFMTEEEYEEEIKKGKFSLKDLKNGSTDSPRDQVWLTFPSQVFYSSPLRGQADENGERSESSSGKKAGDAEAEDDSDDDDSEDDEDYSYAENGIGEVIDVYVTSPRYLFSHPHLFYVAIIAQLTSSLLFFFLWFPSFFFHVPS